MMATSQNVPSGYSKMNVEQLRASVCRQMMDTQHNIPQPLEPRRCNTINIQREICIAKHLGSAPECNHPSDKNGNLGLQPCVSKEAPSQCQHTERTLQRMGQTTNRRETSCVSVVNAPVGTKPSQLENEVCFQGNTSDRVHDLNCSNRLEELKQRSCAVICCLRCTTGYVVLDQAQ